MAQRCDSKADKRIGCEMNGVTKEIPYGYTLSKEGTLCDEAIEQKVIRLIGAGFKDVNKTPAQIAKFLNEKGYQTRRGTRWTARTVESTWTENGLAVSFLRNFQRKEAS
jgi:hypothetical protein